MRLVWLIPALLLVGCAPGGCDTVRGSLAVINTPARTLIDEKAVFAAEKAYGVALDTVTAAALDGRLKGQEAARVAAVIRKVELVRPALHTALRAANQTDLLAKFNDFRQLTAELAAIGAA